MAAEMGEIAQRLSSAAMCVLCTILPGCVIYTHDTCTRVNTMDCSACTQATQVRHERRRRNYVMYSMYTCTCILYILHVRTCQSKRGGEDSSLFPEERRGKRLGLCRQTHFQNAVCCRCCASRARSHPPLLFRSAEAAPPVRRRRAPVTTCVRACVRECDTSRYVGKVGGDRWTERVGSATARHSGQNVSSVNLYTCTLVHLYTLSVVQIELKWFRSTFLNEWTDSVHSHKFVDRLYAESLHLAKLFVYTPCTVFRWPSCVVSTNPSVGGEWFWFVKQLRFDGGRLQLRCLM